MNELELKENALVCFCCRALATIDLMLHQYIKKYCGYFLRFYYDIEASLVLKWQVVWYAIKSASFPPESTWN